MALVKHQFEIGQIVYAKQKGYPPWPSMVAEKKNNTYKVVFFGWNQQWVYINGSNITNCAHAGGIIQKYFDKNKKFTAAEIEKNSFVQYAQKEIEKTTTKILKAQQVLLVNEKREKSAESIMEKIHQSKHEAIIKTKQPKKRKEIVKSDRITRQNVVQKRILRSTSK